MALGTDTITGDDNDNHLKSNGNSDDTILGLGGNDDIDAGAGIDIIDGGEGNDVMNGGAHSDTFLFGPNSGVDIIEDFRSGEDTLDLSATGITDLTGLVTDNANGYAVIDLGGGNSVTLEKISAADFLADPTNFILATGPVQVTLGIDDTFSDPGDFVDHVITGDVNGEALTDTDMFIFGPNNGDDTVNDFQYQDLIFNPDGTFTEVPGDVLDLSALGIFGDDLGPSGFLGWFNGLLGNGLIESYSVTETDTIINFTADDGGGSLSLLGIGEAEIGIVIELNMVRDTGGSA